MNTNYFQFLLFNNENFSDAVPNADNYITIEGQSGNINLVSPYTYEGLRNRSLSGELSSHSSPVTYIKPD